MDSISKERSVNIIIGKSFSMYGVNDIRAFDEGYISLDTSSGKITVEGKDLKIESLSKEDGHIFVCGEIGGVFCESSQESKKGIIRSIFGKK